MATSSFLNGFRSLFLLFFIHFGCFFFSHYPVQKTSSTLRNPPNKRRKISPLSSPPPSSASSLKTHKYLSFKSYLSRLLSFHRKANTNEDQHHPPPPVQPIPPSSPVRPFPLSPGITADLTPSLRGERRDIDSGAVVNSGSFASRGDIYPCSACGEVLLKPHLLDLHHATKHSLSDLTDGDSGKNIVSIIFLSGWRGRTPTVHRILKIHNSPKTVARFEEYRELVRSRAAHHGGRRGGDERCIADGNERLRFYCSTILCSLGRDRSPCTPGACGSQFCVTCGIVRHGFSGKHADVDGIGTHGTSWAAHVSLPEDLEEEFAFLRLRRTMLVCRVVAGRVARAGAGVGGVEVEEEGEKGVYDSVVPVGRGGRARASLGGDEEEEMLVYSPRALLPCFIIIYTA